MKIVLIAFALTLTTAGLLYSQDDSGYKSTLKKMFEVSGSEEAYKSAIRQMFVMFKQKGNVPEDMWAALEREFLQTSMTDLVDMLTPVYQKHLTIGDLEKLIEFYQTPVGKKFSQKTPFIMQESMQVGQQWGIKIGQEFEKKLKDQGY